MSARQIHFQSLVCDGCGVEFDIHAKPVARVRQLAADDGWTHRLVTLPRVPYSRCEDYCGRCSQ